jgi:hypothetical protein
MVFGLLRGDADMNTSAVGFLPFAFGDVDPGGPFMHVFDETASRYRSPRVGYGLSFVTLTTER